jgi:hypothetical protein
MYQSVRRHSFQLFVPRSRQESKDIPVSISQLTSPFRDRDFKLHSCLHMSFTNPDTLITAYPRGGATNAYGPQLI